MIQTFPCGCKTREEDDQFVCDDCHGLQDSIYQGNLKDWVWRAQHAECKLDDLITALKALKRHYGIDYEYSEVPWVKGTDIDKLL